MHPGSFIEVLRERAKNRTLRELAADLGLPESSIGVLSKALNGKPIAAATERRLRRALGFRSGNRSYKSLAVPSSIYSRLDALRRSRAVSWGQLLTELADRWEGETNA